MKWSIDEIKTKIQTARADLEHAPVVGKIIRKSKKMSLPGFQHVPLYDAMRFYVESLGKGIIFQRAAALTYRIFIALVPMIIALFSAISFFGESVQQVLLEFIESVVPTYAWTAVSGVVTDLVTRQNGTLSFFMLVIGVYFTIVCMNGILVALSTAYYDEIKRNFIKQIGYSFVLMFVYFIVILIVAMLFIISSVMINNVHERLLGGTSSAGYIYIIHAVKWLLIYTTIYLLVSFTYYITPVDKTNYRFFSAGSITCTVLLVILLWVLNVYFSNFTNYNVIYGSLGALFAILLWINWSSVVLLIGYDLNVSIAKAKSIKSNT
ncbi:MAG: YihY/virulence factor BrkB family protein [Bacteroidales bacterium]|nr:YihY/virulence factor BrkB family protein [Bacteroidales bacterium]MBR3571640.1 YihY/virulence factor BrkB family protein [Bacteroidales bacterium]